MAEPDPVARPGQPPAPVIVASAPGKGGAGSVESVQTAAGDLALVRTGAPTRRNSALAARQVLVVGINYEPELTGIAPYTTAMSRHLAASAAGVTVLTGVPHYPHWTVPAPYRLGLRSTQLERVPMLPDDASSAAVEERTMVVRRLRHYVPASQSVARRAGYELTFLLNALTARTAVRPDVVIAVTPSLGGAIAGARLAARHGARLLVVVQDLMAKAARQSGISGGGRIASATAAIERHALVRADRVAIVSESFRAAVEDYGVAPDRISLLPNWTRIQAADLDLCTARQELGWQPDVFTVAHTGNMGLKQDLGNVVDAARLLRDEPGIEFVMVGDGSQRRAVQEQARDLPNFRFVPTLDNEAYPKALAASDVLLVNERPGVADMSLPSKLTSYFSAGRPVLAAVEPGGATAAELARTSGAATVVPPGDPAALADAVRRLRSDPPLRAEMAIAGRAYALGSLHSADAAVRLDALLAQMLESS